MGLTISATCNNCKKSFEIVVKQFLDSKVDKNGFLPSYICPFCSSSASIKNMPYIFFDRDNNILYYIINSSRLNQFKWDRYLLDVVLREHLSQVDPSEQRKIKKAETRFIEESIFIASSESKNDGSFIIGLRNIRFTPALKIKINPEFIFLGQEANFELSKNEIGYIDNGIPPLYKEIVNQISKNLLKNQFIISIKNIEVEQQPVITQGLTDFIFIIGSLLAFPILANVISDIITDFRHNVFSKSKMKLQNDDEMRIFIKENKTKNIYFFEGSPDNIVKQLKDCASSSIHTLTIPGSCHVAISADDLIADLSLSTENGLNTFRNAAKEYIKHFDPNSCVEIVNSGLNSTIVSLKAKKLMDSGDYFHAYWLMKPYIDKSATIELLFNYAYCINKMGEMDEAEKFFYEILKRFFMQLDLNDLSNFTGNNDTFNDIYKSLPDGKKVDISILLDKFTPNTENYSLQSLQKEAQSNYNLYRVQSEIQDRDTKKTN